MEYYRATTACRKMQATQQAPSSSIGTSYNGGVAPMDIGALHKGKGYKGRATAKEKDGYKVKGGKGQGKGSKGYSEGKTRARGPPDKHRYIAAKDGNTKATKENERVRTATQQQGAQDPATAWWTDHGQASDNTWWHGDQGMTQQTHQLMLPAPTHSTHQQQ